MSKQTNTKDDRKEFSPHLVIVLKEMCHRVKAKYADIDFKSQDWFRQYKWTIEEQGSFEKWFADYLHKDREARRELCDRPYVNKSWCLKAAKEFTFMYGWALSDSPS